MTAHLPSLVAERAVRYLREAEGPVSSVRLAREVLAVATADEGDATRVLGAAFAGDARLRYGEGGWRHEGPAEPPAESGDEARDLVFVLVEGARPSRGAPVRLNAVVAARRSGGRITAACGGALDAWPPRHTLKGELREILAGAGAVVHAPPGGIAALERWLEAPLEDPLPLARLGRRRAGLREAHAISDLAGRLGLAVRVDDDPARRVGLVEACFDALVRDGETREDLLAACRGDRHAVPWERFAFTSADLRSVPAVPGTYRFFDADGALVYVGKSASLARRLASWFRDGAERSARERAIVERVHRFEVFPSGSDLEAVLREAAAIARDHPEANVLREVHASARRARRLTSILILEPAEAPWVLRAFLIRDGRLVGRVPLGPRGGGLARIAAILEREFFSPVPGPRSAESVAVDVEIVARWLAEHRDRTVAFDPTHLGSIEEVVERLRWFLDRAGLRDGDGLPILPR